MNEKIYTKTFVAFFDILGFKDIVMRNTKEDLRHVFEIFRNTVVNSISLFEIVLEDGNFIPNPEKIRVHSLIISDSLIMWTESTNDLNFFEIVMRTRMILNTTLTFGLPLRAAITCGELIQFDERKQTESEYLNITSALFGKSVVDGYELCNSQRWSGCIVTNECIEEYKSQLWQSEFLTLDKNRLHNAISIEALIRRKIISFYNVPLRNRDGELIHENYYVVDWARASDPMLPSENIRDSFSKFNKQVDCNSVQEKIINTLKFYNSYP